GVPKPSDRTKGVKSAEGQRILAEYEKFKNDNSTAGDRARAEYGNKIAINEAQKQLDYARRAGADQNTIRSYEQNIRQKELQSQYFGPSNYQKPNTSDPNVWVMGTGKDATLHSTGGSAGYARGTFSSANTTPQTALSTDPYLPQGESAERAETWRNFYEKQGGAYKPASVVEAEKTIVAETQRRQKVENMADQLGIDTEKQYKQFDYIQQISDVSPMTSQQNQLTTRELAKQNIFSAKKQQELEKLEFRISRIDEELQAEKARIEGMGQSSSESNMMSASSRYAYLKDKKDELLGKTQAIQDGMISQVIAPPSTDLVSDTQKSFSGITAGNPFDKGMVFSPVTSGYSDPSAREGTAGTIMDNNFTLDNILPSMPKAFADTLGVSSYTEKTKGKTSQETYDNIMEMGKSDPNKFATMSGMVTIKGVNPKSAQGQALQKQYAKQAKTAFENEVQSRYFSDYTAGKVPFSKAMWSPETTQAYKIDGKLQETMGETSVEQSIKYFEERGLDVNAPVGELNLTPVKYSLARTQATMGGSSMGMLPDTPDTPYTREGDFGGYVAPEQRMDELVKASWTTSERPPIPDVSEFETGGSGTWAIEDTSKFGQSADWNPLGYIASGGGYTTSQLRTIEKLGFGQLPKLDGTTFSLLPSWKQAWAEEASAELGITPRNQKTGKSFTDSLWQSLTFSDRVDTGKLNESFKMDRGFA
ncbi:hypothetical protein OAJ50_05320, partial [Candidatus Nitrosopelagicus sp.]|nr:hypothetical protein [Candidatus Nitrosopelagicus sp.]